MRCPFCSYAETKVTDSRDADEGIRRRRECLSCRQRFTTMERAAHDALQVAKKDGRRETFSREKLLAGLRKACEKRPLPAGSVEAVADAIEADLHRRGVPEVSGTEIGELVMAHLRELDHIAYIRFASVYREFADLTDLEREMAALASRGHAPGPGAGQPTLIDESELKTLTRGVRAFPARRRGPAARKQSAPAPRAARKRARRAR